MSKLLKKVLFRADDLGYSEAVNYGIEKSVKEGLIRSVGVMVNMPATQHGVALLKNEPIAFSLHTNICVGKPLVDSKLIPSLVDEHGFFKASKIYRSASEDFVVFDEVMLEINAQYQRFIELFGRKPDYFEGHAVASETFFKAMEIFTEEKQLIYSGLPKGAEPNSLAQDAAINVNKTKVYLWMESMQESYEPYHSLENMLTGLHEDGVDMMIFHPGYLDQFILENSSLLIPRTKEVTLLTDLAIKKRLDQLNIELISYKEL
ncbi:ChbG/HpnK family deacetylase [Enterococcus sp. LJL99]